MAAGLLERASSAAGAALRLHAGGRVGRLGPRPESLVELYEFEGCPYCRKAREALSILDLDALIHPCPKNGPRFRPALVRRGGKAQFPYLVDANAGIELYESDAIVRHLFERYGEGRVPVRLAAGPLTDLSVMSVGLVRPGRGIFYREARPPEQRLELYSYEASPACRLVRERLCVLELPYHLHNRAPGSQRETPDGGVPSLVDPNRGLSLSGAPAILRHLDASYAA